MQIISGTKREITIREHTEQLEKSMTTLNNSMECFRRFKDKDSLERLLEDCTNLVKKAKSTKEAISFMDEKGIE